VRASWMRRPEDPKYLNFGGFLFGLPTRTRRMPRAVSLT